MVRYQVATVGGVWLPEMHDLSDHSGSGDDYAGNGARIDRFRACYGRAISPGPRARPGGGRPSGPAGAPRPRGRRMR